MPALPGGRVWIDEAYTRRMMVEWRCFKERQMERQQEQVLCTECGKELEKGSLVTNRQTQHGMAKGGWDQREAGQTGATGTTSP